MKKAATKSAFPKEKRMKKVFLMARVISKVGDERKISTPVMTARTMKMIVYIRFE